MSALDTGQSLLYFPFQLSTLCLLLSSPHVGNIKAITDHLNSSRNQTFAYDDLNRLTQAQGPYGPITYNYDPIGNMTYNSQVGYYTYDIKPHAVTQAGSHTYTYDANGNMLSGAGRTLIYDHENKPISINSVNFVYDANGDRVKKGSTVYIEKLFECSVSDCTKYIFANGRRVALKRSTGEVNYYSQDHLGSTTIVIDATGAKVEEIYYYPYGATRSDTGSVNLSHKYTGQELDDETDLYYYGARYYDAVLSKFISPDPVGPYYSNPQELNRYSYVKNNPPFYTDPTGNQYQSGDWDPNMWVNSIYGPLGSFGSSISQLGSFSITTSINFRLSIDTSVWNYVANNPINLKEATNSLVDKLQSWWKDPLGTKARGDRGGYGYGDINLTVIGLFGFLGGTISVQITPEGYVYVCPGVAAGTKGTNLSGTMSNYDPSPGLIVAAQVTTVVSGQLGYSFETESFFGELGGGLPAGFSVTCIYCLGPFGPFDAGRK